MSEEQHAVESVPGIPDLIQKLPSDVMQVSDKMILLTWLAFGIAAFCLHKLLWKPLLRAVASREKSVSDALEGAERARKDLSEAEVRKRRTMEEAHESARGVAERAAREAAAAVARADRDAKATAQRRMEDAEQAIAAEQRKAFEAVRRDAAAHIADMVEGVLRSELTDEQKRAYQRRVLGEVKL